MKVKCIEVSSPRSDGRNGPPTGLTVGFIYEVAEVLGTQYSIINDDMKIARYSQHRFEVVEYSNVPSLRNNFNKLTWPMRQRIRELEAKIAALEEVQ